MKKPNFFMVGAPKCGTTAMYQFLNQHPDIFMHPGKEPNFFADELFGKNHSLDDYLSHYKGAQSERVVGEASTWYLYSTVAAMRLRDFDPDARILIMLRNPVDMIYALHSQLVYGGQETIKDFREALEAEPQRREGKMMPDNYRALSNLMPERLLYRSIGLYSEQVSRYLAAFDRSQIRIILFDDFKADPERAYLDVIDFLGIDDTFRPAAFSVINANKYRRFDGKLVQRIRTNPFLVGVTEKLIPRSVRKATFRQASIVYGRLNSTARKRPPLDPGLRDELTSYFAEDIDTLAGLIGRDLSAWKKAAYPLSDGRKKA